jgi:hypothetical protein
MTAETKATLHRLVDELPDGEIHTAQRFLEYLTLGATTSTVVERAPGAEQPTPDELEIRDAIDRAARASRLEVEERQAADDAEQAATMPPAGPIGPDPGTRRHRGGGRALGVETRAQEA